MGERTKVAIPFGGGLDRTSGIMVVEPTRFSDIRNAHLTRGRTELRKGLSRTLLYPAGTDLIGTFLIRAQGLAGGIVYDSATRIVSLYAVDSSAAASAYIGDLWTLPAGATSPPRVIAADSFDQLIIAHDEPIFPLRQNTMVYSPSDGTLGPLMLDLAREGTSYPAKFRGVAKHLEYVVAWGYGTHLDEDRGEVLRVSKPGEPTTFVPEHYLLFGQLGDPIIGGGFVNGQFCVQKVAQSFKLAGYDRSTFAAQTIDPAYGLLASRLQVSVNDEYHFWSLSGPRMSNGGATVDLGLPLELQGPNVDPGAVPDENGFAFYDPNAREIVYVFGQWAYVLHFKDGERRWSFRRYAIALTSAGLLYVGGSLGLGNVTATPTVGVIDYIEPTYAALDGDPKILVRWTLAGASNGEMAEVWIRPQGTPGAGWKRKAKVLATTLSTTITLDHFRTTHDVAVRLTSGGFAAAGYTSTDPLQWPVACRTTKQTLGDMNTAVLGKWQRFGINVQGYNWTQLVGPSSNQTNAQATLTFRVERSNDGGATWPVTVGSGMTRAQALAAIRFPDSDSLVSILLRIRVEGPASNSGWLSPSAKVIAPEPPATVTIAAPPVRTPNNNQDNHDISWTAPNVVDTDTPADGPFEVRGRHISPPSAPGAYNASVFPAVGVHLAASYVVPLIDPSTGGVRTGEGQVRVKLATGDVSPWTQGSVFEP